MIFDFQTDGRALNLGLWFVCIGIGVNFEFGIVSYSRVPLILTREISIC